VHEFVERALRIVIVDDSQEFLSSVRAALEGQAFIVAGVASTNAEALEVAGALRPDAVLVDVHLGEESGIELAEQLVEAFACRVVLISASRSSELVDLIAASSAVGFMSKVDLSAGALARLLGDVSGSGAAAPE
jgi:DNA-binding NarL/FixJ family response regulator